jgi:hypothetical protein
MSKLLTLYHNMTFNEFILMQENRPRSPTYACYDEKYDFRFHWILDSVSDEIVGFSNEGSDLARDYPRLMELLEAHPVPGRYDVPDLDLTDATLPEIITTIYERYVVGQEPEFTYPPTDERHPTLQVADRPTDKTSN